jgi:hypothetical protein
MPLTDAMKPAYWIECGICHVRDIVDGSQGIERAQDILRNRGWRWNIGRAECPCCSESSCDEVYMSGGKKTCRTCEKNSTRPADFNRLDD